MPFIRKTLFFTTFVLSLMCIVLLSRTAQSYSSPPTTVKLQLFWHHQFEFAGFYAAISKGYFDKYNINVELIKFDPSVDSTHAVLKGQAHFGLAGTDLIEDYHQGKDVKLLASYFKRSPLIIITQPEITSLKQLSNNKVYGLKQQLKQGSIREMLNLFDIEPAKINMTRKGNSIELFEKKEIAGILAYRTNIPFQLNQKKLEYRIFDPNQFGIASQDLNLFITAAFAQEHPVLVKNFTLAANEGWSYAIQHPNEIIELIKSQYNTQNLSKDALKFEAQETIKLISPELFKIGSIQKNKLFTISEESFANKSITSIKNLDGFIFQINEQQIAPELLKLLNTKEKNYLLENPVIKVQNESDYPPFNYSVNGKPAGYSIDYVKALAKKMGVTIQFIQNNSWQEYLEMLRNNQLDAMVNTMATSDRKQFFNFTSPFAEPNNVAVTIKKSSATIIDEEAIQNKKFVVVEGYAANEKYEKLHPSMTIIKVKNVLEALRTITLKEADFFILNDAVINFYIEKHYLAGLKLIPISKELEYPNTLLSIATNISNLTLANIFQKAMSTIAEHETIALRKRWFNEINNTNKNLINLTQQENEYLVNNPVIKVQNDGNYPPFNFLIKGKPSGYSVDLMNKISIMLGIKIEYVINKEWSEYLTMLEENDLDMMINIIDTKSRRSYARFTNPYAEIATMAVIRKNESNFILTKAALSKKRIALSIGYGVNESIKRAFPDNNFIEVNDTNEALKLISLNKADVYFEAGSVADYYITKNFMTELQIVSVPPNLGVINQNFRLATNKENTILLAILQKALNSIPEIEQIELRRKWFREYRITGKTSEHFTQTELDYIAQTSVTLCRPDLNRGSASNKVISLIDLITRDIGLNIKMSRPIIWADALQALQKKECDLLLEATATEKRKTLFNFTPAYYRHALSIVTKKDQKSISDIYDHLSKPLGVLKGSSSITLLKQYYPTIKLIEVSSLLDGIELVKQGHIFGYIYSSHSTNSLFNNNNSSDLKINAQLRDKFDDLQAIATRKDDKVLHSILSKAIKNVDKEALAKVILKKESKVASIIFNKNETKYLKSNQVTWCRADNPNAWDEVMSYFTKLSLIKLVKSKKMSWHEAMTAFTKGECDVLPEAIKTLERSKTMNFTQPIHQEERVIVTQNKQPFISNIINYLDKEFLINKGDILYEQLKRGYPTIRVKPVVHAREGLTMVKNGKAFAYIGSISTTGHELNKFSISGLKIAGTLSDKYNNSWAIATKKSDQILSNIFSKIVDNADKNKIREIVSGQLSVKYEKGFDYTLFWQMLFIALVILMAIILWNRRLAALNLQLQESNKVAEQAQQQVESQNHEILATHQQLVQSEKMASLGTLTAGVAHEINNPTSFTYAAVYMMQSEIDEIKIFLRQLAGGDDADVEVINSFDEKFEKLIELAKTACEGTNRIKVIVEDLRTFARLDDAKQAKIQVSELITSTIHLVQTQYENITINTEFEYDPVLKCFPSKLNQVFMNIIVNACQSIKTKLKQNPQLNSKSEQIGIINISTSINNNYLIIHIKDNGCGMDKLTQQKVCDPFFTTKDVGSGTGLGMAISFGIIEEHDGILKISSNLNKGSEFSVYLPVEIDTPDSQR